MLKKLAVVMGVLALTAPAWGYGTPVIEAQSPNPIVPLPNAVIPISAYGENIPPDNGNHPDYTQYWHIFVRSVAPDGTVGPWTHCVRANGCLLTGFNSSEMDLEILSRNWANLSGSQFQLRYYTGLDDSDASDPSVNKYGQALSGWSNIVTWQVRTPVAAAPPAPPKPVMIRARTIPIIKVPEAPTIHAVLHVKPVVTPPRNAIPPH